jgi:hypothetical protein
MCSLLHLPREMFSLTRDASRRVSAHAFSSTIMRNRRRVESPAK